MTIKDFRGQVKVSDVQNAFDEIVNRINSKVDVYNSFFDLQDYDLTKGSPLLGAPGYTLSVGGLKSVLNSYANTVIGCRTFRIDDETLLVSDGFCITPDKVYRINSQIMGGASAPDVRPEASESYYGYLWGKQNTPPQPIITQKNENVVEGHSFNHLNSIPFEFNKVYRLPSGSYDASVGASSETLLCSTYKFGAYNSSLNKVVPICSFGRVRDISLYTIPSGSDGDVITNTVGSKISCSSIETGYSIGINYVDDMWIQKVLNQENKIDLYVYGRYYYGTMTGGAYQFIKRKLSDESNSTELTDLLNKCEYIIGCYSDANSNYSIAEKVPYYEIDGTLDTISDISLLGEAKYYPTTRPAMSAISTEEIYYNYIKDKLIFNAYKYGSDIAYVDKKPEGGYVLKLKNTGEIIQDGGIVFVSYLNWNSEDVLLNGIKNLQLEDENISMTTQNVNIPCEGHVRQTLDTSSDGKFVSFVKRNTTNAGSTRGVCDFMGLNLINSYNSESGLYRRHWVAYPINIIYIPYKFNPTMQLSGATGRYVYSYNINRKT